VDGTGENRLTLGTDYRRGVTALPTHFLLCSFCHSGGVLTRLVVEGTDAFD